MLWQCGMDDDTLISPDLNYDVPETYSFSNVDYEGQNLRLRQLREMASLMWWAPYGLRLSPDLLRGMFENDPNYAVWNQPYDEAIQLRDQTFSPAQSDLLDQLFNLSATSQTINPAVPGEAGFIEAENVRLRILLGNGGLEPAQVFEKGLMGACFYFQATAVLLGEEKMAADNINVIIGKGTAMEHNWDQAFGYLGVPANFEADTTNTWFWGNYLVRLDALLDAKQPLKDAFLTGRAAISNKDLDTRDQAIGQIRQTWERLVVGAALHHLNAANAKFEDRAQRMHELSQALGFIYSLRFNPAKSLSDTEINDLLQIAGGNADFADMDLYQIQRGDILEARTSLAADFGLQAVADQF